MENMFKELQERIKKCEEILSQDKIDLDTEEVKKIEAEREAIEAKIEEIKSGLEGKSKIEKMKATLNITSLESELSLKDMDLEEAKKDANSKRDNKIKEYNQKVNSLKNGLNLFIKNSEKKLSDAVKASSASSLILSSDLEEIKGYYLNIITTEKTTLNSLEKEIATLRDLIKKEESKIKSKKEEADNYFHLGTSMANQPPTSIFGNVSAERVAEHQERLNEALDENIRLLKIVGEMKEKLKPIRKEEEKLIIRRDAASKKIENINLMIEEMIKELVQEELKNREIIIPEFVQIGRYFKVGE